MVRRALFDDLQMLHVTARDMLLSAFPPAIYGERLVHINGALPSRPMLAPDKYESGGPTTTINAHG